MHGSRESLDWAATKAADEAASATRAVEVSILGVLRDAVVCSVEGSPVYSILSVLCVRCLHCLWAGPSARC